MVVLSLGLGAVSCQLATGLIKNGGEQIKAERPPRPAPGQPSLIIFALDGVGHDQLMAALGAGKMPNLAGVLGPPRGADLFAHAYSVPKTVSMMPSSTVADWSAVFTGLPPAWNGLPGDEWFDRSSLRFFAPVPITVTDSADFVAMLIDDLVGKQLKVPTLYEQLAVRTNVSMQMVHRGATVYTILPPTSVVDFIGDFIAGEMDGKDSHQSVSGVIDTQSVGKAVQALDQHGIPALQTVYFPGIDIYTHASPNPLPSQVNYLETVTDPAIGHILAAYRRDGAPANTYVIVIADHGNTPVPNDARHDLGVGQDTRGSLWQVLAASGFRVRPPTLKLPAADAQTYQAVIASQGFMANIYLANRATCRDAGARCDWSQPPRLERDVMPAVRALYRASHRGHGYLAGAIDLIFARPPVAAGHDALPFEIYDRGRLVPIPDYLEHHPRPDLVELNRRMRWLGAGPYGDRAGDIILLAATGLNRPQSKRYYFAAKGHWSFHGSASIQDSYVPFIVAQIGGSGAAMEREVKAVLHGPPSQMAVTPLALRLLNQ
ncbi:MAG TPA: alkaline phosphatase family protein [Candidatus Binataceae bacterium]|nr:alkaline phosphatase family protein [Candidatus Binataceae bacterium]